MNGDLSKEPRASGCWLRQMTKRRSVSTRMYLSIVAFPVLAHHSFFTTTITGQQNCRTSRPSPFMQTADVRMHESILGAGLPISLCLVCTPASHRCNLTTTDRSEQGRVSHGLSSAIQHYALERLWSNQMWTTIQLRGPAW